MASYNFSRTPVNVPLVKTKNREINTAIPAEGTGEILQLLDQYESRSMHGQMPIIWDKALNFNVFDKHNNKWIDFTSTIFVTNIGHANKYLKKRLQEVLDQDLLHTYAYANELRLTYLKKLIENTPSNFEKAFLLSAGTEATEAALKLMRLNGLKNKKRKLGVICFEGNWHGRTMGAQMMGGNIKQKEWIGYLDPNIYHLSFPYPWSILDQSPEEMFETGIKKLVDSGVDLEKDICGLMLETFQGWGAVFYPKEYVQTIKRYAEKYHWLLTFDEMQAGFCRTGTLFGYEHYDVIPDLICCGKGISSGVALSAVLGTKEIMDLPDVGDMSSTHSANPLSCAAGLATLEYIIDNNIIENSNKKGQILHKGLNEIRGKYSDKISYVLGKGMIAALIFSDRDHKNTYTELPSKICEKAMQKGLLLVHTGRESIKIAPPLTISEDALLEGISVIDETIAELI